MCLRFLNHPTFPCSVACEQGLGVGESSAETLDDVIYTLIYEANYLSAFLISDWNYKFICYNFGIDCPLFFVIFLK